VSVSMGRQSVGTWRREGQCSPSTREDEGVSRSVGEDGERVPEGEVFEVECSAERKEIEKATALHPPRPHWQHIIHGAPVHIVRFQAISRIYNMNGEVVASSRRGGWPGR
jgi:hypothetical protein